MLVLLEGLVLCFIILLVCVVGIADGPEGMVFFYEKEVQERVVQLGLISEEKIRRNARRFYLFGILPGLLFTLFAVYFINRTRGFWPGFLQISSILLIEGLFDRLFIDGYWVGRTKAWVIPGTEDLMPYIYGKTLKMKWLSTFLLSPLLGAVLSGILSLFLK